MATTLQFRRGTTAEVNGITGAVGELIVDTTKDTITVHDGSTAGGTPLATESFVNSTITGDVDKAFIDALGVDADTWDGSQFADYLNQPVRTTDDVTFNDVTVSGDLIVSGNTTIVNTETINLADNKILLNSNETGSPSQDSGIEVERGTETNVSFVWNETTDKWDFGSETVVATFFEGQVTDISNHSVGDLDNVDITSVAPSNGDALVWNGTYFVPQAPFSQNDFDTAFGSKSVGDLSDVDITSVAPSNGDALVWDGTDFVPQAPFSQSDFDTAFSGKTTDDLAEGSNEYYTVARANTAIDARVTKSFVDALNVDANTANQWSTARTITLSGDVSGSVSIDGTQDVTITTTVTGDATELGVDTTGDYVKSVSVTLGTGLDISGTGEGADIILSGVDATSATKGVASFVSGDFSVTSGAVSLVDTVVKSIVTDSGTLTPTTHEIDILGGEGMNVTHTGNVITVAGEDATTSNKGIASFSSSQFDITSGAVSIKDATTSVKGIASFVTGDFGVTSGSVSLADTVVKTITTDSGALTPSSHGFSILGGEGMNVTHTGTTVTVTGEDATTTNKGVASFESTQFDVASGLVSIKDATTTVKGIASFNTNHFTVSSGAVSAKSATIGSSTITLGSTTNSLSGLSSLTVGNLSLEGNILVSTNTNGNIQLSPNGSGVVDVSTSRIANVVDPVNAKDAATKEYVDTIAAASLHYHTPVRVETPTALSASYNNGSSGVGATLTNTGTLAAITIDGVALSLNDRVLVYNQSNAAHNGVYYVSTVGSGSVAWVLTRATDADSYAPSDPDSLGTGDSFYVKEGDTGAGELYVMNTEGTITFGTTPISFTQISSAQIYSAGTGLTLSGTEFSVNSSQTQITQLGTITTGTWQGSTIGTAYGGTGQTTYNSGEILVGNSGGTLTKTTINVGTGLDVINGSGSIDIGLDLSELSTSTSDGDGDYFVVVDTSNVQRKLTKGSIALSGFNNDSGYVTSSGVTAIGITAGTGLSGGGTVTSTGTLTLNLDLDELTTSTTDGDGDFFIVLDSSGTQRKLTKGNINLSGFNNDAGYTTNIGDITQVSAGGGLTGGGTSGSVTISHADTSSQASVNNSGYAFIQDVTLDTYGHVTGLSSTTVTASGLGALTTDGSDIKSVGSLRFNDNIELYLGTGTDVNHYFNGTNYYTNITSNTDWYVQDNGVTRFTFGINTGELTATNFNATSDEKLKKNITTITGATDIIKQLNGVEFDWKENDKKSSGVIAQELEKILPHLVSHDEATDTKSVNYSGLIGYLIETVKELNDRIEKLENNS